MKKKSFYLLMSILSLFFFTAISVVLTCIMPCTKANAIIVLSISSMGALITLAWFDSFNKARN